MTDRTDRPLTDTELFDALVAAFGFPTVADAALDTYDTITRDLAVFSYYADAYDGTIPRFFPVGGRAPG